LLQNLWGLVTTAKYKCKQETDKLLAST
jgi:hypothetical protein